VVNDFIWDFKFSRRRVWRSESSGMYCRVLNWMSTSIIHRSPWWWRQHVPLKRRPTFN
jgi:hypothetical protein